MLCLWMSDADTGNTIFVGNASTGEIYEPKGLSPEWRADPKIINKFKFLFYVFENIDMINF